MRNVLFVSKFVLACILGLLLQLTLHEMGHALFAFLTGNEIVDIHIGIVSYAGINVLNAWSIPIISVASFIFPVIVCAVLELIPVVFVRMLNTVILTITTIQLAINSVAILFVKDTQTLQTYDLGIVITSSNLNNILLSIVSFVVVIFLGIWIVCKLKKIVEDI